MSATLTFSDPAPAHTPASATRPLALWLAACALLVACMVLVGGYTRLSGSGLSITEWKPVHGVIPPLSPTEWQEEFEAYRTSPQYAKINKGMSLEEFKGIYWPEFWHRVLGRSVGLVFFLPFAFFLATKRIPKPLGWKLAGIFALGGLQGFAGWYMVKSGLVDHPFVSHLRLSLHLGLAFLIFALLLWQMLNLLKPWRHAPFPTSAMRGFTVFFMLLCLQVVLGALTAGLHAGLIYNTYPTMNGAWVPGELFSMQPLWVNFIENAALVQFMHRWMAAGVVIAFVFWSATYWRHAQAIRPWMLAIAAVLGVQFMLGVLTLLHAVPLALALKHQMTALMLFALSVTLLHGLHHNDTRSTPHIKPSEV